MATVVLGDPRVVPGFRYPFCPGIPSSPTPGSSIIVSSSAAMSTRPSPRVDQLGTPKTPAIRFTRAMTFVASWFTHLLRSASLLAPCTDLTGCPASGAFTSRLPAGWSPFPLQDITTTATGLLCWRDSHPLEWQLASLHLLLHRDGLAPSTPCRSPGALRSTPVNGHIQGGALRSVWCHKQWFVLRLRTVLLERRVDIASDWTSETPAEAAGPPSHQA